MYLLRCQLPAVPVKAFHLASLRLLQHLSCVFLEATPYPPTVHPNPESEVTPEGRVEAWIDFSAPLLAAPNASMEAEAFLGQYWDTFDERSILVRSGYFKTDTPNYEASDNALAAGRHEFLRFLLPHYLPELAVVDSIWDHGIKERHLENCELRRLFWTTYFGKKYVEKHGRQFFLDTPAWKVEEIADGILITVTEKYLDFSRNEPKETLKHLRQKFKGIRPNRYKEDPNF